MASGDTKTEAMLNALGNGGSADEFRGCCNTKTQQYILDAIDRVQNVEDEVEELKNNPDVVDIVDTYADLQAYDTQHLTENDIIRVLQDETHSGNSTYYRFTKNPDTWTFIGEVSGGAETVKTLTSADYNYPTDNPNGLAPWLLDPGLYYTTENNMNIYNNSGSSGTSDGNAFYVARARNGAKSVLRLVNQNWIYTDYTATGTIGTSYTLLGNNKIQQTTGTSTSDVMSQKAVTDALASVGGGVKTLTTADYDYPTNSPTKVALWKLPTGFYTSSVQNLGIQFNTSDSFVLGPNELIIVTGSGNGSTKYISGQLAPSNGNNGWMWYTVSASDGNPTGNCRFPTVVVDNLTTTQSRQALSANQGKVLKDLIDALDARVAALEGN